MSRKEWISAEYPLQRCVACGKQLPVDQQLEERCRIDEETAAWVSGATHPSPDVYHRHCRRPNAA